MTKGQPGKQYALTVPKKIKYNFINVDIHI